MACSSACPEKQCNSYGECLRRKNLQIDKHALGTDMRLETRKERALVDYADLRQSGSQPQSPRWDHVEHAKRFAMRNGVFDVDG